MKQPFFVVVLLAAIIFNAAGTPLQPWICRSPLPQGNALNGISFLNGQWVTVGEMGTILTSIDGTNWTTRSPGIEFDLTSCAYGNGTYVVVGDYATVLTSKDGISWTQQNAGTFSSLQSVVFANNQFVAVGENTSILTSPDGITWTLRSSGDWKLYNVVVTNGLCVAAGGNSTQNVILTSPDGDRWSVSLLAPGNGFSTVAYGAGAFVAATTPQSEQTTIWVSTNGIDWQQGPSFPYYGSGSIFRQENDWLLAVNDDPGYAESVGQLYVSTDLLSWAEVVTNTAPIAGIASDGRLSIACCNDGSALNSLDATNWDNPGTALVVDYPSDLEFLNGQFVDLGWGEVAFSKDGTVWTNYVADGAAILSITYGNGIYVAGGQFRTVAVSSDAVNWTNVAPQTSIAPYVANVSVAFGKGVFVGAAGYEGDILTSPDGTNWLVQQLETNGNYVYFSDVKFGQGRFVAVGGTAIATSADGTNWFYQNTNQYVSAVACGNGLFVATGPYGTVISKDGTNWMAGISTPLNGIAFGDGFFVAVGSGTEASGYSLESPILVSTDGFHWTTDHSNTARGLDYAAFGDGSFVVAGDRGIILQSEPLVMLGVSAASPPQLQLNGPIGHRYRIDYSSQLGTLPQWQELRIYQFNQAPATIIDTNLSNSSGRFYRAVLLP